MVEGALRQDERHLLRTAFLAGAVARHQPQLHGQAGPGMGAEIGLGGAALLARVAAGQGERHGQRLGVRAGLQADLGPRGGDAPVVLGGPGQAQRMTARCRAGRLGEGDAGRGIGLDRDLPAGDLGAVAADGEAAAILQRRLDAETVAVQCLEAAILAAQAQLRRATLAAGQGDAQRGAGGDAEAGAARLQEERRHAGIAGRRHPGLQPQAGDRGGLAQAGQQGAADALARLVARHHEARRQGHHEAEAQRPPVACRQAGPGRADAQVAEPCRLPGEMGLPQGEGGGIVAGGAVAQRGEGAVTQAGGGFDAAVGRRRGRGGEAARGAPGGPGQGGGEAEQEEQMRPEGHMQEEAGQGGEQEEAQHAEHRPGPGPEGFPE